MREFIKNNKRIVTISSLAFVAVLFTVIVIINATKAGSDVQIDGDLYITASAPTKDANNIYTFTGELYTKKETKNVKSIDINLTGCKGGKSVTLHGYVNQSIEYGEYVTVTASTDLEIVNCKTTYNVTYNTEDEGSGE
jgi:hypothetical protein